MKNNFVKTCLFLLIITAFSACQAIPAPAAGAETPMPTDPPALPAIQEGNAEALEATLSEAIGMEYANLTWTSNGNMIWSVDLASALLYDAGGAEEISRFVPGINSVIFDVSADGKTIAYAVETDDIRIHDLETGADTVVITTGFPYSTTFFSPDGKTLAVPSLMDIKVVFFDVATGEETGSVSGFSTAAPVYSADYSPDGKTLLWFSRGTVQPMDIATQALGPVLSHEDFVSGQLISPDGKVIATTAAGTVDGEFLPLLTLWNASNGNVLAQNVIPTYSTSISFSPDSKLIAAGTEDSFIIFTSPYGDEVARYGTAQAIADLEFSPDGTRLATISNSGLLQIYAP